MTSTEDITVRLRAPHPKLDPEVMYELTWMNRNDRTSRALRDEAADEIERLRAEIERLKACSICGRPFVEGQYHVNCADTLTPPHPGWTKTHE